MDSPDLESLLAHFNAKINNIHELIPLVRLCFQKRDQAVASASIIRPYNGLQGDKPQAFYDGETPTKQMFDKFEFPDLTSLTEEIYQAKDLLNEMNELLDGQREFFHAQRISCETRIKALNDLIESMALVEEQKKQEEADRLAAAEREKLDKVAAARRKKQEEELARRKRLESYKLQKKFIK